MNHPSLLNLFTLPQVPSPNRLVTLVCWSFACHQEHGKCMRCVPSGKETFHGSCPSKVMTGVRIDLFAVATGRVELEAITTLFAKYVGRHVECVQ
ncbi:hypothetical protein CY34DRAFT_407752 [Suillus luteus UH-Slu-Lm8-n1]|uniref:Uncharacterized protein n=1 Tax=Suillus luteus UH-Slu-Lm8-n1 TaxID=930992 RepID=A0A0C9ZKW6_9AGAM|nr:hypothetical protein CY34DRAFT_407752 [Suillus luteus UH-Slu-Lm8-n1]